jgi:hypothetical protein
MRGGGGGGEGGDCLGMNVVHRAQVINSDVHGVDDSFDESGTESCFGRRVFGNVLGAVSEGIIDVGIGCLSKEQAAVGRCGGGGRGWT